MNHSQLYIPIFLIIVLCKKTFLMGRTLDQSNYVLRQGQPQRPLQINTNTVCGNSAGITRKQYQLCVEDPNSVAAAIQGVKIAIHECKRQFKDHKWNCTSLEYGNKFPHAGAFFKRGYPETSFAYAIASAGVAHAVAHACSLGKIERCRCVAGQRANNFHLSQGQHKALLRNRGNLSALDPNVREYLWSVCDHDINYGIKFSQKFLDERVPANDKRTRTILHNNRVGRLIVGNNMARKCTCHGTSGSCSTKTCWKHTPDFVKVGKIIKDLYFNAFKLEPDNRATIYHTPVEPSCRHCNKNLNTLKYKEAFYPDISHLSYPNLGVSINRLVFFEDSPDYCNKIKSIGHHGTKGRFCNKMAPAESMESCRNLCCGRGARSYKVSLVERCNCKFHWCCYVVCGNCTMTQRVSVCK